MITIILGMHRSGTSAIAGLLHSNGIVMGREKDFYPPPMKENPKGFYENVRFRRINDKLLQENGYRVKSFNPVIPLVPIVRDIGLRKRMKQLIREYDKDFRHWGWKDPRTSLTLDSWLDVMEEMEVARDIKIIIMLRPSSMIAKSMRARGNKERYDGQFSSLAIEYISRAVSSLRIHNPVIPSLTVNFNNVIADVKFAAEQLEELLEIEINDTSFIDPSIARTVA